MWQIWCGKNLCEILDPKRIKQNQINFKCQKMSKIAMKSELESIAIFDIL